MIAQNNSLHMAGRIDRAPSTIPVHTAQASPLDLLNLYLTDGRSRGDATCGLYEKVNRELTWDALLNRNAQANLAPMLSFILSRTSAGGPRSINTGQVSDEIRNRLGSLYHEYLVRHVVQFSELETILQEFAKRSVESIPLKGAWLAKEYYPDAALRPMSDLDLLVRKKDMRTAKDRLLSLGYTFPEGPSEETWEKLHYHVPYIKRKGTEFIIVELHQDIRAISDLINSAISDIWDKARAVESASNNILAMPNEHLLLYLCWHAYHNLSSSLNFRLLWYLDIALFVKKHAHDLDWNAVQEKARAWNVRRHLYFCFLIVQSLFSVSPGVDIMNALSPGFWNRKIFFSVMKKLENSRQADVKINTMHLVLLNLITLDTVPGAWKYLLTIRDYFLSRTGKDPYFNRKDYIKQKYNLSSSKAVTFYSFAHPVLSIARGLGWVYKMFRKGT